MEGNSLDTADPVELARALSVSVRKEQERFKSGQSYLDADTLRSIDKFLLEAVCTVRGLLNSPCPVNRLPPEVLLKIFASVAGPWTPPLRRNSIIEFQSKHMLNVAGLCPLTAVCRYWRHLALDTPPLWSTRSEVVTRFQSTTHYRQPSPLPPAYTLYGH
ncbi:hypothetical protein BV20DRAFT_539729 [Pilatotrama ljubarskyi]|nr:hypothetical protein BV20DRAFT_539729 [Pilatotrama ljubarskyi]